MKGIELPINILVIVAIAVIVLLGMVALYFVGFNPFSSGISVTSLKNSGCTVYAMNYNCGKDKYGNSNGLTPSSVTLQPNTLGTNGASLTTLQDLCDAKFIKTPGCATQCAQLCGC